MFALIYDPALHRLAPESCAKPTQAHRDLILPTYTWQRNKEITRPEVHSCISDWKGDNTTMHYIRKYFEDSSFAIFNQSECHLPCLWYLDTMPSELFFRNISLKNKFYRKSNWYEISTSETLSQALTWMDSNTCNQSSKYLHVWWSVSLFTSLTK